MQRALILFPFVLWFTAASVLAHAKPNVLLIAVDDLNDWVGCLGGHSDTSTPNIDRLARRGVLFTNAHCQSPVCNPSRASLMTSLYSESTGIYFLDPEIAASPVARKATPMTVRFARDGYHVAGAGKLYHNRENGEYIAEYAGDFGGFGPRPKQKLSPFVGHPLWDWGVYPERDEDLPDHKIASWATAQFTKTHEKPLFLAVGFHRPHVPQYAPKKWFDMHADSARLPEVRGDDLADVSPYAIDLTRLEHISPPHDWVVEHNQWKPLVLSYLACVTFVDAQIGRVIDALDASGKADETIIVLFSDHGFHLGEKRRWCKQSIWEESTRVPLIIVAPGVAGGRACNKPVELIDIYPTLLELTGLRADATHEGQSLVPLLKDLDADWPHVARSSFGPGNVAIRSERYRYIVYRDGSEEFYDHTDDPHEWNNRSDDPLLAGVIAAHRKHLPTQFHPILGTGSTGHKAFAAAEANLTR